MLGVATIIALQKRIDLSQAPSSQLIVVKGLRGTRLLLADAFGFGPGGLQGWPGGYILKVSLGMCQLVLSQEYLLQQMSVGHVLLTRVIAVGLALPAQ